jgi:putative DNA primase/helicase
MSVELLASDPDRDRQNREREPKRPPPATPTPTTTLPPADDVPPAAAPAAPTPPSNTPSNTERHRFTEIGNARRFAAMHGHRLRYVQSWKRWLAWDGKRWCRDEMGAEMIAAKAVADSLYADVAALAARAAAGDERAGQVAEPMVKWARTSSKAASCRAMLTLAQSEEPIGAAALEFDRDSFVLNLLNGTLDLRSGRLRPHRQADMLTRLAPVAYHPQTLCPQWDTFLERVLPDEDVRRFVQRFIGYCLTGDVSEQVLAFVHGLGANGKSVLLDVMLALLGDYGCRAAPELVLAKQGEAHPTEIADLEGRRFVVCSEVEQGRAWAESLIKRITGDTTITARHMKQDFYTFTATHKLVIAANTRPTVRGTDDGIWRRMRLVPFNVTIPPAERDRGLVARLVEQESSGILTWAVAGCLAWQREGLGASAAVDAATAEYRGEQDVLGLWIDEECVVSPGIFGATTALYNSFKAWCERTGRQRWTREAMRARLAERPGITTRNTNVARGFDGIGLVARQTDDCRVQS